MATETELCAIEWFWRNLRNMDHIDWYCRVELPLCNLRKMSAASSSNPEEIRPLLTVATREARKQTFLVCAPSLSRTLETTSDLGGCEDELDNVSEGGGANLIEQMMGPRILSRPRLQPESTPPREGVVMGVTWRGESEMTGRTINWSDACEEGRISVCEEPISPEEENERKISTHYG